MNCNTTHYRANSSSVPGDPTPVTLEDLSKEYGISRERVRQIEARAFDKLQKAIKNQVTVMAGKTAEATAARANP